MTNLNDFIDPDLKTSDVIHSIGYAAVDGAGAIGGASGGGRSLDTRRRLNNQPRVVGSYQFSEIGRRSQGVKARTADQKAGRVYDASSGSFGDRAQISSGQRGGVVQERQAPSAPQRRFVEPPARGHNPFA